MLERIVNGRTDLVLDYLAAGNPATSRDSKGVSLIEWCAYYGDVTAIRLLIANGESAESLGENLGLNAAAYHGHWRLCEFLIEKGADPNRPMGDTGEMPLHLAICKANRPSCTLVLKVLLSHGADPNRVTAPSVETGAFMRDTRTKGETPLHRAAAFGSKQAVRLLLDAGASRDAKDQGGDTPLGWASWHLRPDAILRMLCYDGFSIPDERDSTFDHGTGWGVMETSILGNPRS